MSFPFEIATTIGRDGVPVVWIDGPNDDSPALLDDNGAPRLRVRINDELVYGDELEAASPEWIATAGARYETEHGRGEA